MKLNTVFGSRNANLRSSGSSLSATLWFKSLSCFINFLLARSHPSLSLVELRARAYFAWQSEHKILRLFWLVSFYCIIIITWGQYILTISQFSLITTINFILWQYFHSFSLHSDRHCRCNLSWPNLFIIVVILLFRWKIKKSTQKMLKTKLGRNW